MTSKCVICGGSEKEHEGRAHEFTLTYGDLKPTKAQKEEVKPAAQAPVAVMTTSTGNLVMDRLVELLVRKGILTPEEMVYMMFGVKPG